MTPPPVKPAPVPDRVAAMNAAIDALLELGHDRGDVLDVVEEHMDNREQEHAHA